MWDAPNAKYDGDMPLEDKLAEVEKKCLNFFSTLFILDSVMSTYLVSQYIKSFSFQQK